MGFGARIRMGEGRSSGEEKGGGLSGVFISL